MSHHITTNTDPQRPGITALTIHHEGKVPYRASNEVRVSLGPRGLGGLVVKVRGEGNRAFIHGEDLFALRAFLEELPEEQFVEPAPAKPRWTKGDLVRNAETGNLYECRSYGKWLVISGRDAEFSRGRTAILVGDDMMSACVNHFPEQNIVLRQASAGIGV